MAAWSLFFRSIPPNAVFFFFFFFGLPSHVWICFLANGDPSALNKGLLSPPLFHGSAINFSKFPKLFTSEYAKRICQYRAFEENTRGSTYYMRSSRRHEIDKAASDALNSIRFNLERHNFPLRRAQLLRLLAFPKKKKKKHLVFIDPEAGQILIDGQNVQGYEITSLRRHIGVLRET